MGEGTLTSSGAPDLRALGPTSTPTPDLVAGKGPRAGIQDSQPRLQELRGTTTPIRALESPVPSPETRQWEPKPRGRPPRLLSPLGSEALGPPGANPGVCALQEVAGKLLDLVKTPLFVFRTRLPR